MPKRSAPRQALLDRLSKIARRPEHRMTTRSKASKSLQSRIFDLPEELRNMIYSFVCASEGPICLTHFALPRELSLSRRFRSEAIPILFDTNVFAADIRSNWCVKASHFHRDDHIYFEEAGIVNFSPFLSGTNIIKLPEDLIRFRKLSFKIGCCCCRNMTIMATLSLSWEGKTIRDVFVNLADPEVAATHASIEMMCENVQAFVDGIFDRDSFNGFKVGDIKELAKCFIEV